MKIYDAREGGGFPYEYPPRRPARPPTSATGRPVPRPGTLDVGSATVTPTKPDTEAMQAGLRPPARHNASANAQHHKRLRPHTMEVRSERLPGSLPGRTSRHRALRAGLAIVATAVLAGNRRRPGCREKRRSNPSPPASRRRQAGAHPDLVTSFELEGPGAPEAGPERRSSTPRPVSSATPAPITQCTPADFALDQCPSDSQAGLITDPRQLRRQTPNYLLGTAPIFSIDPGEGETARFSFIVPILDIPIAIPVTVRTTSDYGLRFTVQDITQLTPLAAAKITFWGFPAVRSHEAQRFPKGTPGHPAGCPGEDGTACNADTRPAPAIPTSRSPTTRPPAPASRSTSILEVADLRRPRPPLHADSDLPADRQAAKKRSSNRFSRPARPPTRPTPPRASTSISNAPQFLGLRRRALRDQIRDRHPAARLHDQSRRRRRPERMHRSRGQLRLRGPGQLPRQLQDRHLLDRHPGAPRPPRGRRLHRRTEARRPVPPLPHRLWLRHQRQARRLGQARPA